MDQLELGSLRNFLAGWSLTGQEKCFDQLAFAADDQFRKPLEPPAVWDFGLSVHPPQQKPELLGRDTALLNAVQQMIVQRRRQVMAANLRHESFAVEPALHRGLQPNDFCRITRSGQPFSQIAEFVRAQLSVAGQLERVPNDFGLLFRRQAVQFFDHFGCCHESNSSPAMNELQVLAVRPNSKQRYPRPPFRTRTTRICTEGLILLGSERGLFTTEERTCPPSVGPIPAMLGQRSEGAQAEEQETTDDSQESHRNRIETAGG
jgi:hypothetical protein